MDNTLAKSKPSCPRLPTCSCGLKVDLCVHELTELELEQQTIPSSTVSCDWDAPSIATAHLASPWRPLAQLASGFQMTMIL